VRWIVLLAACTPLPPPPVLPTHAFAMPDDRGTTTAMVVVGIAEQPLGGGGFGMALRVEHQQTDRTTLGIELTGGVQDGKVAYADGSLHKVTLLGLRGYGRWAGTDNLGVAYGVGLTLLNTGALIGQIHGGGLVGADNGTVGTVAQVALALSIPILRGTLYGAQPLSFNRGAPETPTLTPLRTDLWASFDVAGLAALGDHERVAIDAAIALPLVGDDALVGLSFANAVH